MMRLRLRIGSVSEYEANGQPLWRIEAKPVPSNPDSAQYFGLPAGTVSITALRERPEEFTSGTEVELTIERAAGGTSTRR